MSEAIAWDGMHYPYVAPKQLRLHESVHLHEEAAAEIDPVTHEILRYMLWSVNLEQGNTMLKISGSPIGAYGHDFNPAILDEKGDSVLMGPFLQFLSGAVNSGVKWTLENRGENPGIEPGDIFIANDPWMASTHQPDVAVMAPVFVEDRIFCWVANTLHQWDLGGTAPGGFNPAAEDVFWEAPCIPPVKVVEGGVIRKDMEDLYARFSRMPKLVGLDLRAEIVGCRVAVERIQEIVERYSAPVVKACMRKLQDDSEAAFVKRLETIEDGTWSAECWIESKQPGDRGLYRNRLELSKRGDRLTLSNRGSHPQIGAINCTFVAWAGAIMCMLTSQMLFDQMFVTEGARRHVDFDLEPGLINSATRPASVSGAPPGVLQMTTGLAELVISKMLATSTDAELRTEVQSVMGAMSYPQTSFAGTDQRGNEFTGFFLDPLGAALPAFSWRDGEDTGGYSWDLQSTMPNVEDTELFYPVLYLWRRELPDSGGAGKYRGGNSAEWAVIPHKTDSVRMLNVTSQICLPAPGLFGGMPSSTHRYQLLKGADPLGAARDGSPMPVAVEEVEGERHWLTAKSFDDRVEDGDVWVCAWSGASGYGDPLLRDPELVEEDVRVGRVSRDWAERAYGVVVGDRDATERLRASIRAERLGSEPSRAAAPDPDGGGGRRLTESLRVGDDGLHCGHCGTSLGAVDANWKADAAASREQPLTAANPIIRDPAIYTDEQVAYREYYCPGCATMLDNEIAVAGAAPLADFRLDA